jgi:hypothetical protein
LTPWEYPVVRFFNQHIFLFMLPGVVLLSGIVIAGIAKELWIEKIHPKEPA